VSEGRDLSLTREQIKAQFIVQEMFPEDPAEPSPP
jgi:hypothetical protein